MIVSGLGIYCPDVESVRSDVIHVKKTDKKYNSSMGMSRYPVPFAKKIRRWREKSQRPRICLVENQECE